MRWLAGTIVLALIVGYAGYLYGFSTRNNYVAQLEHRIASQQETLDSNLESLRKNQFYKEDNQKLAFDYSQLVDKYNASVEEYNKLRSNIISYFGSSAASQYQARQPIRCTSNTNYNMFGDTTYTNCY